MISRRDESFDSLSDSNFFAFMSGFCQCLFEFSFSVLLEHYERSIPRLPSRRVTLLACFPIPILTHRTSWESGLVQPFLIHCPWFASRHVAHFVSSLLFFFFFLVFGDTPLFLMFLSHLTFCLSLGTFLPIYQHSLP